MEQHIKTDLLLSVVSKMRIKPLFGKIIEFIVTPAEETLFILRLLNNICQNVHFHSFEVCLTNVIKVLKYTKLLDYHPLHLCHLSGRTCICPKYYYL